jgi:glycine/D-amino acid oxidase-like deaminating enzyme
MPEPEFDTLILGQGLAGSALAWALINAGQRVCVIDDGHRSSSSMVAAGLINPLAGLRFNRRPEVADWLSAAEHWYADLARQFGQPLLHPLPMLRLFRSAEQRRFYHRRVQDPASRGLIGPTFDSGHCPEPIAATFGGFTQQRTGYVDLPLLLATLHDWLAARDALLPGELPPGQIEPDARGVSARVGAHRLRAERLVFCDGARARTNPWFGALPLVPEKGEILNIASGEWRPRHIINGAYWLVPLASGELRLGATHGHGRIDAEISAVAREELLAALHALRPGAGTQRITRQQAGIRPGSSDRYPLIGRHPEQHRLWIFNGFGARGALIIPWYAQRLAAHLHGGAALPAEADIRRFA